MCGVTETRRWNIELGGVRQRITLEDAGDGVPVMVMFHGGPWSPFIYGMAYAGYYPELARHASLLWWDQYGCGRNYERDIPSDLRVGDFADMAVDLVRAIHRRYPHRPIVLNGFSFGTYLTMEVARRLPRMVDAVINVAPIMNMRDTLTNFDHVLSDRVSAAETRRLSRLRGQDRYDPYLSRLETLISRHTRAFSSRPAVCNGMVLRWLARWVTSADYRLRDLWGAAMGSLPYGRGERYAALWDSMGDIDLWPAASGATMPVLYLQGEYDRYVLPSELRDLAERRDNVRYARIAGVGHIPDARAWRDIESRMIRVLDRCRS